MNECYIILVTFILFCIPNTNSKEHICGKPIGTKFKLEEDRIVAGYDVGYYRYPWYAAVIRYGKVVCGGALIGPKTVVTAAHCYKEFLYLANKNYLKLEPIYTVKMGVYNICATEHTQRDYKIEKVQIHEMYYLNNPYYDIALLTLAEDTSSYQPICLPKFELKEKPKDGTVPGLGTLKYQGAMPCTVHEARLLIYNDSDCHDMIRRTGNNDSLITNAFCAGYLQGGIDTCQGDSGGPLQSMNDNGDFTLIGIVSFGFRCAVPGLLGMYTDISEYLDWIQEKSGLDAGIVNIIYNKTSPTSQHISSVHNQDSHKKRPKFGKPFRRPIKIVLYKNSQFWPVIKTMLHHPII